MSAMNRKRLGTRAQVLLLFGLLMLSGAVIVLIDEHSQYRTRQAQAQLKDEALQGLRRLMAIGDAYGIDIAGAASKRRDALIGWEEAQDTVAQARSRIALHWSAVQSLPHGGQQAELFARAWQAREPADAAVARLAEILHARDAAALTVLADSELPTAIEPVLLRVRRLSDALVIDAERIVQQDIARTKTISALRIGIALLTLIAVGVVARALVSDLYRGIDSLSRLSEAMRRRDFDVEPAYRPRGELGEVIDTFLAMRTEVRRHARELQVTLESNDEVRRWLQERDIFQRSLLAAAQTAILSVDADGRFTHVNPFAERLLGYRAEQLVGCDTVDALFDPAQLSAAARECAGLGASADWHVFRSLAEQQRPAREWHLRRADGSEVPVLLGVSAMTSSGGELRGLLFVATDLTDIKQLELELRASEQRAREASRAKSAFIAAMSHEIRTPLSGVTGMLEVLAYTALDAEQRRAVQTIQQSADMLLQIIGDILDFSKIEAGRMDLAPTTVDLRRLVSAAVHTYSGAASSKGLRIDHTIDAELAAAHVVDPVRLRQILANLLSNAVKFTERGSIGVQVQVLGGAAERQQLLFSVADTGIGVSAAARQRLFRPFTQAEADTNRRYGGTGLGLAICRRLATLLGGTLEMDSTPGVGSTLRLRLDLPVGDAERIDPASQPATAPLLRPLHCRSEAEQAGSLVLLVDDHPTNRLVIARQLALAGYVCEAAEDGTEALRRWRSGRFALLLADVHMPRMDGYQLARAIRAVEAHDGRPRTPIIALTAAAMQGEAERCAAAGMDDYLTKPVSIAVLADRLQRWLPHAPRGEPLPEPSSQADHAVLDDAVLDALAAGDPALARSVLRDFIESTQADLERLRQTDDAVTAARQAHRIKGAARLVGAQQLAAAAAALEQAARAQPPQATAEAQDAVYRAFAALQGHVERPSAARLPLPAG